jgi:hypothetical protein
VAPGIEAEAVKSPVCVIVPFCGGTTIQIACVPETENCCCWEGPSEAADGLIWACAVEPAQKKSMDKMRYICLYDMFRLV